MRAWSCSAPGGASSARRSAALTRSAVAVDLWLPNEVLGEWQVLAALQDLWNTMALPTLLMLIARFAPALLTRRPPRARI